MTQLAVVVLGISVDHLTSVRDTTVSGGSGYKCGSPDLHI